MTDHHRLSRRHLIAGGAAATAGALAGVGSLEAAHASAGVPPDSGDVPTHIEGAVSGIPVEAAPAINPAYTYLTYGYDAFHPVGAEGGLSVGANGLSATTTTSLRCPLSLPNGSVLRELTYFVYNSSASTGLNVGISTVTPPSGFAVGISAFTSAGANTHTVTITSFSFNPINTTTTGYALRAFLSGGTVHALAGARLAYTPPPAPMPPQFVAIAPARVYDSRLPMAPLETGRLNSGSSRTVSVANRRDAGTGVVDLADVVPASATSVSMNVTVDQTAGAGFVAVNPGVDPVVRASTINWSGPGATLANGIITGIVGRDITLIAGGGGSAHVIVDVTGYFLS
jgi:hypothetical protein